MVLDSASRLAWRLMRRVARRRSGSRQTFAGIHRFSVFQGSIRLAGTLSAPAPIARLSLHLPGGEVLPVPFSRAADGCGAQFDVVLNTEATGAEAALAALTAALADGTEWRQEDLGRTVDDPFHGVTGQFTAMLDAQPAGSMLEVGARARSGVSRRDMAPPGWHYSGFDILAGPNVDVVGDAHALSQFYRPESFDAVIAFSVLEHLLMPWKFVIELNRVLKRGASGLFVTHQTWPLHDQPWDFWRFSDRAWTALLNPATGYEIIDARMGEPAFVVAQRCNPITAFPERATGALASAVTFRKIGPTTLDWPVALGDILQTQYPSGEITV